MKNIAIALIDREPIFRGGLRLLLEKEAGFVVVGETADGLEGLGLIEQTTPDVVITEIVIPGLGGTELARRVVKRWPKTRVVILTSHAKEQYVLEALRIGVCAYVLKDASPVDLIKAIREAVAGRRYLSAPFSDKAVAMYLESSIGAPHGLSESLTNREREVLHLAAEGLKNSDIAERLGISPRTVEKHRSHAMHKLGVDGQTALVHFAMENGLLPPPDDADPRS